MSKNLVVVASNCVCVCTVNHCVHVCVLTHCVHVCVLLYKHSIKCRVRERSTNGHKVKISVLFVFLTTLKALESCTAVNRQKIKQPSFNCFLRKSLAGKLNEFLCPLIQLYCCPR